MTGMPAAMALDTGSARGWASLGLMMSRSILASDELLHLGALLQHVVLRVLEDHLDLGMLVRLSLDVGVHLHAPGLSEVALAHPDDVLGGGKRREHRQRAQESRAQQKLHG